MSAPLALTGVFTALVTPFTATGELDLPAFEALVAAQVAAGVAGVVPVGTTGESPTVTDAEAAALVAAAVRLTRGTGVRVVVGTGSNDTRATVAATRAAAAAGADAALVVVPYYSRPTQAGLLAHFTTVATEGGLPIVVYNIPGRAGVALAPATLSALLAAAPAGRIAALKDASGGVDGAADLALAAPALRVLSGDDALTLPFMSVGAVGVVSVVSNVFPRAVVALVRAAAAGDFALARALHEALLPFTRAAFVESNPGPVKHALAATRAIPSAALRLPLAPLAPESATKVGDALAATRAALAALGARAGPRDDEA
jgi:4-hydroxy-tetrahydrodipicolinate synthase